MVIEQAVGPGTLIDEDDAKAEIQKIEHRNRAIRVALLAKIGFKFDTPAEEKQKREQALLELETENPLFEAAIKQKLRSMLPPPPVR